MAHTPVPPHDKRRRYRYTAHMEPAKRGRRRQATELQRHILVALAEAPSDGAGVALTLALRPYNVGQPVRALIARGLVERSEATGLLSLTATGHREAAIAAAANPASARKIRDRIRLNHERAADAIGGEP